MASKQPFRFFDWKNKLSRFTTRVSKTFKHKVLSKSRNALILSCNNSNQVDFNYNTTPNVDAQFKKDSNNFDNKLKNVLKRTWQIYEVTLPKNNLNIDYKDIQQKSKGRQYDAIIVMPQTNKHLQNFPKIDSQQFPTSISAYQTSLMKNILAYRLAHKYLATSGVLIYSNSQADFAKVQNKDGIPLVNQPAMKNVLDAQISYLAVVVGDRDYTDLNSWSVVGLAEEFVSSNPNQEDFVVKMYSDWADGRNLPMPGSFALFKMNQQGKKSPFVQYL